MAITYPIQDSDRFTVYDTNTQQPLKDGNGRAMRNQKWGSADTSQMIQGLANNIKWLIEVREPQPAHDQATQKLRRLPINYDVLNETATVESWEVVNLTQEEIDMLLPPHFEYNNNGIKIGIEEKDQAAFANLLLLLNESGTPVETVISIKDIFSNSHAITVGDFKPMIIAYGFYCYELFNSQNSQNNSPQEFI